MSSLSLPETKAAAAAPRAPSGLARAARSPFWLRIALLAAVVVLLEIYGRLFADPAFMRPPTAIVAALFESVLPDPKIREALWLCVVQIAAAYALATVVGVLVGLAVGSTRFSRVAFFPIVLLLFAIPQVSLLPLVILIFGLGPAAKIAFGFSHGVFPIIMNVVAGMRDVKELHMRAALSMGASRRDVLRYVILPHMTPSLFTGLRLGMTMTLLGVILAELYVSTGGVGYYTRVFAENYNPAPLFALIGCLAVIAIVFNELVRIAENRLTPGKRRAPTIKTPGKE
ncbi:MAG TPA: ABC transporter permease subunit [Beijerinckiaceae bacterium]|jgi:NitT/TauT family transport system permease protein